jgi:hypothetical protein
MSYYQYEPPVAMFSMAEVDKYNNYQNGAGIAVFGAADMAKGVLKGAVKIAKMPFRAVGGVAAKGVRGAANVSGSRNLGGMAEWAEKNPGKLGAGLAGLAVAGGGAGAGGVMFMRRRRSKTGKMIVEQVRR